jgi:hypothetical protein
MHNTVSLTIPPIRFRHLHLSWIPVLNPVVTPWPKYLEHFSVDPANVGDIQRGNRLVHEIKIASVEDREIHHVALDALDGQTVLASGPSIRSELVRIQIEDSYIQANRGE